MFFPDLNMTPIFSILNFCYTTWRNIKIICNFILNNSTKNHHSYFWNVFGFKFGLRISFSNRRISPTFSLPVRIVFPRSSKKQVVWIYTRWIVTFVKCANSFWDISEFQSPRYSMCRSVFSVPARVSVAIFIKTSSPFPAESQFWNMRHLTTSLINFFPKSLLWCFSTLNKLLVNCARFNGNCISFLIHAIYELICKTRSQQQLVSSRFNLNQ